MKMSDPRHDLSKAFVVSWAAVSTKAQDKYSIEDQLKLERAWCAQHGATVVEELVVRGFSRDYWTLADVVAAASHDPDMEAFAKLQEHIRRRDFTVFLCFDADRFGRTASLVHEVIGRITRDCEALIYTLFDGVWMDEESATTIGTMKAYKAQQDVARMRGNYTTGMDNRARDGKATSAIIPLFQKRIRDEKGKEVAVVINEDLRSLWTDLATLILRGVSWNSMEQVLFDEFGHGRRSKGTDKGEPYNPYYMHDLVMKPSFWGHGAVNYRMNGKKSTKGVAPWIWDEHAPVPKEVTVYRNTLPAVYGGEWSELGELVKQQLWNWHKLQGRASHSKTYRFHGLFVCDVCGYTLTKTSAKGYRYLRCQSAREIWRTRRGVECDQTGYLKEAVVQEFFHKELERKIAGLSSMIFDETSENDFAMRRIDDEKRRLKKLKEDIDAYSDELVIAPKHAKDGWREKINIASDKIEQSIQLQASLEAQAARALERRRTQDQNLKLLMANGGVAWLWEQSDAYIHQFLTGILGNRQITVKDRRLTGTMPISSQVMLTRRQRNL